MAFIPLGSVNKIYTLNYYLTHGLKGNGGR